MATQGTRRNAPLISQGTVNLGDLRSSISTTRTTFTRLRARRRNNRENGANELQPDFITLVTLVCSLYRDLEQDLIPIQQFHPDMEQREAGGHTCIVSQRAILTPVVSNVKRGTTDALAEDIVVKRTRESVLALNSGGLKSFLNELRIRTHPPIRNHPNIAAFKGVAWDFEDEETEKPRPLLLEELAPQRSLESFWRNYDFVRMTFRSKIDFSLDIANGLAALHASGIVHGDVKPDNILVFPRIGHQDSFMAKLTDFGHSVSVQHKGLKALPAFTPPWSAPEVLEDSDLTFKDMIAADVYSYGLVVLSIMIGRSYHRDIENYEVAKGTDTMLTEAIKIVEREDQQNQDSDFELDTIRPLLLSALKRKASRRSLRRCTRTLHRYIAAQRGLLSSNFSSQRFDAPIVLGHLDITQTICVGYQTLGLCSYQLKSRIVQELHTIAGNGQDPRQFAAAWELSICYFSGFGTPKNYRSSSHWLTCAANHGIPAAEAFCLRLHQAMGVSSPTIPSQQVQGDERHRLLQSQSQNPVFMSDLGPITETEVGVSAQSRADVIRSMTETHENDQVDSLSTTERTSGDEDQSDSSSIVGDRPIRALSNDMIKAISDNDVKTVASLIEREPEILNGQDYDGNTPLLIAARCGGAEVMNELLCHEQIDASICNISQESTLHVMSKFSEDQIRALIPRLIARKADPSREALPGSRESSLLNFSTSIRCCPVLRSILEDNLTLLQCLLDETHKSQNISPCRICEAGSRLRRIIAVTLSTFRSNALGILLDHIKTYRKLEVDLSKIEVWQGRKLIPLWKVPFQNLIIKTIDLPGSFFRAMSHGDQYIGALSSTLSFLVQNVNQKPDRLHAMLREAVKADSLDTIKTILYEAQKLELKPAWWVVASRVAFLENPILLAIKFGQRDIFEHLWTSNSALFQRPLQFVTNPALLETTRAFHINVPSFVYSKWVNVSQICLSLTITAPHQDKFFLNYILEHASRSCIIKQPTYYSDYVGNQSTCFLSQAILTSSFRAASIILQKFPEVWHHRVQLHIYKNVNRVSFAKMVPWEYFGYGQGMLHFITGEYYNIAAPSIIEYILLVGSYKQCRYVLENVYRMRSAQTVSSSRAINNKFFRALAPKIEEGEPSWLHCRLTPREYWCLLLGCIVRDREDRRRLWDIVRVQVSAGHPKSMLYLRLALRHGNNRAITQLLDLGWQVNGPFWAIFMTPLQLSTYLERHASEPYTMRIYSPDDWKTPGWGNLISHKSVFKIFIQKQSEIYENFEELSKQNSETLRARGGKMLKIVTLLRDGRNARWIWICYILTYCLLLPLLLAYATGPYWAWSIPVYQRMLWLWLWAILAMLNPGILAFMTSHEVFVSKQIFNYALLTARSLLQHSVPLLMVCMIDFNRSRGWAVTWMLPGVVILVELIAVAGGGLILFILSRIRALATRIFGMFISVKNTSYSRLTEDAEEWIVALSEEKDP